VLTALAGNWWSLVGRGLLAIGFGVFAWVRPDLFWASLILVFGVYAVVDGVFALVAAVKDDSSGRWGHLLEGIVGIAFGVLVFFFASAVGIAVVLLIGAWAVLTGLLEIVSAVRLRREIADEWLLGIGGVLSIGLGLILLLQPRFGQVITTYILGTYGILFGLLLVLLGLRVRGHRVAWAGDQ
jgi:uncharacterized membrane protein HdeD (DUF308 family)